MQRETDISLDVWSRRRKNEIGFRKVDDDPSLGTREKQKDRTSGVKARTRERWNHL